MSAPLDGTSVRLRDVARVEWAPQPLIGDAAILDRRGVILILAAQYGANTLEVTQRAECARRDLAPVVKAEGITLFPRLFRVADFIETSVAGIRSSLLLGGALVAIVLTLFPLQPAYCVDLAHRDPSNVARLRPTSERRPAAIYLSALG